LFIAALAIAWPALEISLPAPAVVLLAARKMSAEKHKVIRLIRLRETSRGTETPSLKMGQSRG
jgi:hypothetical protein